jgi:Cu/Ag efflux pump CusA
VNLQLKERVPQDHFGFNQPIEERVQDMLAGIKADVAVHVYGDDVDKATVVIGGLITSTPFTLYVLPILYKAIAGNGARRAVEEQFVSR